MNRSIKFRAWDKKLKEMARVISLSFYDEKSPYKGGSTESFLYFPRLENTVLRSFSEIVLEQYTGLKDKNGKEIYEGDIVKNKFNKPTLIYFEEGSYKAKIQNNENRSTIYNLGHLLEKWQFRVIGNIHENADLLND